MTTQFEKAMLELGVKVIHAYSPQAKGRIENLFSTLQDRLVKEMRLEGVSSIEEANIFLEQAFLPKFNKRYIVQPSSPINLHQAVSSKEDLDQIFVIQSRRYVNNDFTVRFKNRWLQLGQVQPTLVLPRSMVVVEERLDGSIHLKLNNVYLNFVACSDKPNIGKAPIALTSNPINSRTRTSPKPSANHPWRKLIINKPKPDISKLQTIGHF